MGRMIQILVFCAGLVIFFMFSISFAGETLDFRSKENPMPPKAIEEVLKGHTKELMSIPGVVGTGQGVCDDHPCIKVLVVKETPEVDQKIRRILEGYPVLIVETGEVRALPERKTDN